MPVGAARSPTKCVSFRVTVDPSDGVQSKPSVPGTIRFGMPPAPPDVEASLPSFVPVLLVTAFVEPPVPLALPVLLTLAPVLVVVTPDPWVPIPELLTVEPLLTPGSAGSALLQATRNTPVSGKQASALVQDKCMGEGFTSVTPEGFKNSFPIRSSRRMKDCAPGGKSVVDEPIAGSDGTQWFGSDDSRQRLTHVDRDDWSAQGSPNGRQ